MACLSLHNYELQCELEYLSCLVLRCLVSNCNKLPQHQVHFHALLPLSLLLHITSLLTWPPAQPVCLLISLIYMSLLEVRMIFLHKYIHTHACINIITFNFALFSIDLPQFVTLSFTFDISSVCWLHFDWLFVSSKLSNGNVIKCFIFLIGAITVNWFPKWSRQCCIDSKVFHLAEIRI